MHRNSLGLEIAPPVAHAPAAVVRLEPPLAAAPAFGSWTRLLGHYGTTQPAGLRRDIAGIMLVGDKLIDALGGDGLARLDETLAKEPPPADFRVGTGFEHRPVRNSCTAFYRLIDETTGRAIDPLVDALQSDKFGPQLLDGDRLRWQVVRQRWRDSE